jgi:hypothetical protein
MATINFCGWETGTNAEPSSTGGTFSVQGTTKRTGNYALQVNPTTTATGYHIFAPVESDGTNGDGSPGMGNTIYVRFYFRYATKPASNSEEIFCAFEGSATTYKWSLRLTSTGAIAFYDSTTTLVGTSSTTLLADTWYRIEASAQTSASTADIQVKIDGTSEITNLNVNTTATGHGRVVIGKFTDRNSQTIDVFYDDLMISDSAFPGIGEVRLLYPNADGVTQQWTAGTGATYAEVDEVPWVSADYIQCGTGGNQVALLALISTATAGISGTINSAKTMTRASHVTANTSAYKCRTVSGATTSDQTNAFDLDATFRVFSKIFDTDPNTSSAWTTSALDAVEIGGIEANAVASRMYSAGMSVDFTPGGSSSSSSSSSSRSSSSSSSSSRSSSSSSSSSRSSSSSSSSSSSNNSSSSSSRSSSSSSSSSSRSSSSSSSKSSSSSSRSSSSSSYSTFPPGTLILHPNADLSFVDSGYGLYASPYYSFGQLYLDVNNKDDLTRFLGTNGYEGDYAYVAMGIENPGFTLGTINSVTLYTYTDFNRSPLGTLYLRTHGFDYSVGTLSDGWVSNTWNTNPYTGSAWTNSEITDLQVYLIIPGALDGSTVYRAIYFAVSYEQSSSSSSSSSCRSSSSSSSSSSKLLSFSSSSSSCRSSSSSSSSRSSSSSSSSCRSSSSSSSSKSSSSSSSSSSRLLSSSSSSSCRSSSSSSSSCRSSSSSCRSSSSSSMNPTTSGGSGGGDGFFAF